MSSKQEPVTDPFEVKVVPKNWKTQQDLTDDAARYRKIRLLALQTNPEAFGSNLERELAFTPQIWQERLQNEDANLIVVERHPPQVEDGQEDDDVGWLGMVVVFKQKKLADRFLEDHFQNPSWTVRYFLAGTFVHPSIRRNGLAERLVQKALEVVSDDARGDRQSSAVVEVQVFERNVGAVKSYTKCGFKTIRSSSGEIATMTLDIEVA